MALIKSDTDTPVRQRIGFIGLGSMGSQMARNLLARGFRVKGYDIRSEARASLEAQGGVWAASVTEVTSDVDFLVLMVVNITQAEQLLFQSGGLDALPEGATVVLMATCPASEVERVAARVLEKGRRF